MINTTVRSHELFSWNKVTRVLSAEASDLMFPPGSVPQSITVTWLTSCEFALIGKKVDREGDIEYWIYGSVGLDHPIELLVFND